MEKVAFITGASRGIGRATAEKFASQGYHLGITCKKNKDMLEDLASELRDQYHIQVLTFVGDVADSEFINQAASQMLKTFSHVDVLINNAGISHIGLLSDMTPDQWQHLLGVNLTSCYNTAHAFIPSMVAEKSGRILSVSSMWGNVGASCEVAYSASKGGIHAFTKALAKELAPSNISVNALACGVIDTEMNQFLSKEEREALAEEIPLGRFASTKEVADALFLLASMPAYVTGQILSMDGGLI